MLLSVAQLSKQFVSRSGSLDALKNVSFSLSQGEILAIVGASGCGKSTLLRLIAGLISPSGGEILIEEKTPVEYCQQGNLGFVFQKPLLFDWRTVQGNLLLPTEILHQERRSAISKASDLLEMVGLEGFEKAYPSQLSGGMRQRVAFARALMVKPNLLLLDEPFTALDEISRENLWADFHRIWQEQELSVILVTHSIREAVFFADRVLVLSPRPGRVQAEIKIPLSTTRMLWLTNDSSFIKLCEQVREQLAG
jgi:NitT/TauT family transport system ATP-binding protein